VTPVPIVTVHCVAAANEPDTANTNVAEPVPPAIPFTLNVSGPHPLAVGVAKVSNPKSGRTNAMLEPDPICSLIENVYDMAVAVAVDGFVMTSSLCVNDKGRAVDVVIEVGETSSDAASVTDAFRSVQSAACANGLVVTPVPTVTVHWIPAESTAVSTVRTRAADAVPGAVSAALNVVDEHPLVLRDPGVLNWKCGKIKVTVSLVPESNAVLRENVYDMDEADADTGVAMVNVLWVNPGA